MTRAHEAVLDCPDIFRIPLHGDDVQDFDTRWDEVLLSIKEVHSDDILESLFSMRTRESDQLKTVLATYEQEIHQHLSQPNYQFLKTMVKRCMDPKIKARNFEAGNERIEPRVLVKTRKGKQDSTEMETKRMLPMESKRTVHKGKLLAVSATTTVRVERKHNRPLLLQSRRHKMTEEGLPTGRGPSRRKNQEPCRHYLEGNCTNPSCDYWHPPVCQHHKTESGQPEGWGPACWASWADVPPMIQARHPTVAALMVQHLEGESWSPSMQAASRAATRLEGIASFAVPQWSDLAGGLWPEQLDPEDHEPGSSRAGLAARSIQQSGTRTSGRLVSSRT